jgi:DNA (cytosine-5)-methyltransferase 1
MRYLSVCSGIEAATVAWHPLGWTPIAFSEIEAFPCAVLAHYYPSVPNLGDMTKFQEWPDLEPDVLVGGTPCQSFSVAGLRKGLHDPRGNLMLTYLAIANRYRPKWLVWENVPGVLSSNGGRDFAALLRGLDELGYGWAYRVLDAQYYGVAQRRRRVFVVGHLGNWQRAAAVLFERSSLSGHPAPSREAGQTVAPCLGDCSNGGGTNGPGRTVDTVKSLIPQIHAAVSPALKARDSKGPSSDGDGDGAILVPMIPHSLRGDKLGAIDNGMAVAFDTTQLAHPANSSNPKPGDPCHTLAAGAHSPAVAFQDNYPKVTHASASQANAGSAPTGMSVRRLTAEECEFLQGFSRGYTLIPYRNKPAADGPRYKALGNSMAVPVMAWIGRRIQMVAAIGDGND